MAKRFLTPINLPSKATDPATASDGDLYFNTSLNVIKVYYDSVWNAISSESVIVSDTAPESSTEGQFWYESDSGDLFIRYDDTWVQTGGSGGGSGGTSISVSETDPVATSIGEGWFKSSTSELFIWDGTYWVEATSVIQGETLPDQTDNSGKFLSTDGSDTSWQTVDALPNQTGNSGKYLTTDGSIASWDDVDAATLGGQSSSYYTNYTDTAESNAISTSNAYSDSLATNYDPSGSASAVASDLSDHESATTSVHGITNTADLATKTYADNAISTAVANLVDSAPETLDTLNELAAALGDDANFAATTASSLGTKAPLDSPALTGTPTAPTATEGTSTTQIATTAFVSTALSEVGGAIVSYQTSAPSSPSIGDIWIDSDEPLITLNSNQFILRSGDTFEGPVVFSDTVSGITPTLSAHLATKDYVDNSIPPPVDTGLNPFLLGGM
jgi:hypothetical protein